jgi:hypothetical protein
VGTTRADRWAGSTGQNFRNGGGQNFWNLQAAQAIRNHWHIENRQHRQKDVRMQEDNDRTTIRHAPHNLASLRNLALIILNTATAKAKPSKRWNVIKTQPWRAYRAMGI